MLYRPNISVSITIPTFSGKWLAHAKLTPAQAGAVASQMVLDEIRVGYTIEQAAHRTGANRVYTRRAMGLTPEQRQRLAAGYGHLNDFPRVSSVKSKPSLNEQLDALWALIDTAGHDDFVRRHLVNLWAYVDRVTKVALPPAKTFASNNT